MKPRRDRGIVLWLLLVACATIATAPVRWKIEQRFYRPGPGETDTPADIDLQFETMDFESGGQRVHGWWIPAQAASGEVEGTVIHVHGNAANLSLQMHLIGFLPREGFNVFMFDYRGFGLSEGGISRANIHADIHAALDAVLARPGVTDHPVGFFAQSLGANHGLIVAAEREEVDCIVAEAPFTSHRDIARFRLHLPAPIETLICALVLPPGFDSIDSISQLHCPALFIHGANDQLIPQWMTEQLCNLAAGPKEIHIIPDLAHILGTGDSPGVHNRLISEFFTREFEALRN